ncbi:PRC-barrel domain-containing protein [Azospirillum sp. B2RO_4]|uniref:PRC-barrel domain-containing protein n=1 Tax=Azospirillum sp. B2RO_4 TaxID=3027796 RepID=UPI003DA970E9
MSTRLITMATAALALTLPIPSQAASQGTSQAQQPGTASQKTAQTSSQTQGNTQGNSQGNTQMQASNADQQCLQQLQQVNQGLVGAGYGVAGPRGYAGYPGYSAAAAPGMTGRVGGLAATPRVQMRTLMRAGYILGINGYGDGCRSVVQAVQEMQQRFTTAAANGDTEFRDWRNRYVAAAVPVTKAAAPMQADDIVGADLRNLRDDDLGDIDNVVIGADGRVQYVLVGRGGFLGIGEELVPVPWKDLRVTPAPNQDTFVLNVPDSVLEKAPSIGNDIGREASAATWNKQVDAYWSKQLAQGVNGQGNAKTSAGSSGRKPTHDQNGSGQSGSNPSGKQ